VIPRPTVKWWKQFWCRHKWKWFRNIYGDEIIVVGYMRSEWRCTLCDKRQFLEHLVGNCNEC
jgi:hypothetical protein